MIAQFREKIALLVFFCLILLGLGGLIGYLTLGHSWNVAATNIDDAAGSMEGYTAILYEGTVSPAKAPLTAGDNESIQVPENETKEEQTSEASSDESLPETSSAESLKKAAPSSGTESSLLAPKDATTSLQEKKNESFGIDAVEESYAEKQATVFTLDTVDPSRYTEGTIVKKGGHRFGVFSVVSTDTPFKIERQVIYFERHDVDFIVVITPDKSLVEKVKGIDVVISTQDEGLFPMGETFNNTFYVSAPTVDSVGAIIISPSNVVSAKVISEL